MICLSIILSITIHDFFMLMNESKRDLNLIQLLNLSMRIWHGVCYMTAQVATIMLPLIG